MNTFSSHCMYQLHFILKKSKMTKDIIALQYSVTLRDFCIKKEITLILSLLWSFIAFTDTRLQKRSCGCENISFYSSLSLSWLLLHTLHVPTLSGFNI